MKSPLEFLLSSGLLACLGVTASCCSAAPVVVALAGVLTAIGTDGVYAKLKKVWVDRESLKKLHGNRDLEELVGRAIASVFSEASSMAEFKASKTALKKLASVKLNLECDSIKETELPNIFKCAVNKDGSVDFGRMKLLDTKSWQELLTNWLRAIDQKVAGRSQHIMICQYLEKRTAWFIDQHLKKDFATEGEGQAYAALQLMFFAKLTEGLDELTEGVDELATSFDDGKKEVLERLREFKHQNSDQYHSLVRKLHRWLRKNDREDRKRHKQSWLLIESSFHEMDLQLQQIFDAVGDVKSGVRNLAKDHQEQTEKIDQIGLMQDDLLKVNEENTEMLEEVLSRLDLKPTHPSKLRRVPPTLGSLYVDRANRSSRIAKLLCKPLDGSSSCKPVALVANGGYGKTRAAIEFAHESQAIYGIQLFVDGKTPESIEKTLLSFAKPMAVTEQTLGHVCSYLSSCAEKFGVLVVFDGVDDEETAKKVKSLLNDLHGVHVVITTRIKGWGNSVREIPIGVLPAEESRKYLIASTAREDDRERGVIDEISLELGNLPLALEVCAAYVRNENILFEEYLTRIRETPNESISWFDALDVDYPISVVAAFELSWSKIKERSPHSHLILWQSASLGSAPISAAMFPETITEPGLKKSISKTLSENGDEKEFDLESMPNVKGLASWNRSEMLNLLVRYSQISWVGGGRSYFELHPVVRLALRVKYKVGLEPMSVFLSCALIKQEFERLCENGTDNWSIWFNWELLVPHILAVAEDAEKIKIAFPTIKFYRMLGQLFLSRGRYDDALKYGNCSCAVIEKASFDETWIWGHTIFYQSKDPKSESLLALATLSRIASTSDAKGIVSVINDNRAKQNLGSESELQISNTVALVKIRDSQFLDAITELERSPETKKPSFDCERERLLAIAHQETGEIDIANRFALAALWKETRYKYDPPLPNPLEQPILISGSDRISIDWDAKIPKGTFSGISPNMFRKSTRRLSVYVGRTYLALAHIQEKQENNTRAGELFWRAVSIFWHNRGPFHPETFNSWQFLRSCIGPMFQPENGEIDRNAEYSLFVVSMMGLWKKGKLDDYYQS